MRFSWIPLLAGVVCGPALARYPGSAPAPSALRKGFDSITAAQAKQLLSYLAGPACEGRGTGQPGFQKAADFVAAHFKAWGLKPMGENGTYFQYQTFYRQRAIPKSVGLEAGHVRLGPKDLFLTSLNSDTDLEAPVALLRGKDGDIDQAGDLNGKIVIVDAEPSRRLAGQLFLQSPAAILYVQDKLPKTTNWSVSRRPITPSKRAPVGIVSRAGARRLLAAAGASSDPSKAVALGGSARLRAKWQTEAVRVPNVVGLIEGSDPALKTQVVGVGAHLDHLGVNGTVVYPGADDDGSGTTALLSIAHAVALNPVKPKRGILFMEFHGEEMDLLGSGYYSDHPVIPHDRMIAELQMDMVGRDSDGVQNGDPSRVDKASENVDTIRLVGSKRISQDLDDTIQAENRYVGFRFKYDAEDVYTRSDHYNFAKHGIPIAFLFDGFHPDYHRPTDTIEKIDWTKLTAAARLYYLTAYAVGNREEPLRRNGTDEPVSAKSSSGSQR